MLPKMIVEHARSFGVAIRNAVIQPSVLFTFALVIAWNFSVSHDWLGPKRDDEGAAKEALRGLRDVNLRLQMRFYQKLTTDSVNPLPTGDVVLAYIDDEAYWDAYGGQEPLNREMLADIITNISQGPLKAKVIGLDVGLFAHRNIPATPKVLIRDFHSESAADTYLLNAILKATSARIPVVLATAGYRESAAPGIYKEIPSIFPVDTLIEGDCKLDRCPVFGYTELPNDERQIPLRREFVSADSGEPAVFDSFSLAVAEAANDPAKSGKQPLIARIPETQDVFSMFSREDSYSSVSAVSLAANDPGAIRKIADAIVLIGGHWKTYQGHGSLVDQHPSPVGNLSGIGLHANYVESLLHTRYKAETSVWTAIVWDVAVGLLVLGGFEWAHQMAARVGLLLAALFVPPLIASWYIHYKGTYLDFLLPMELYAVHMSVELVWEQMKSHYPELVASLRQMLHIRGD